MQGKSYIPTSKAVTYDIFFVVNDLPHLAHELPHFWAYTDALPKTLFLLRGREAHHTSTCLAAISLEAMTRDLSVSWHLWWSEAL
eukprot:4497596-Amphidinium_carterae.1